MNYTCKLPLSGSDCKCILNTEWSEEQVNLSLLHDNKAWHGKFQLVEDEEVAELLDQLSMSKEKYLKETKTALTTHSGDGNFAYSIEKEQFIWKKCVGKNMTVKFGSVLISELPVFDVFEKIIDNTLQSLIDTSNKLDIIGVEKVELEKENLHLKSKCNDLIAQKTEMETLLYSQFLSVLNEKKKKIEELKQKLEPSDHLHDSDSYHSDNDHFGSETEIDSEEDTRATTKLEIFGRKGNHDAENKSKFLLPKRSKQSVNQESVKAGPSRINNQLSQNNSKDKVPPEKSKVLRKSQRNKCNEKSTFIDVKESNSEEDEFTFPKRSRTTKNSTDIAPASKIIYDSDDETDLEQEPESNTVSCKTSTAEGSVNIKLECENKQYKSEKRNGTKNNSNESDVKKENNYEGFSSSTLDILNNLM